MADPLKPLDAAPRTNPSPISQKTYPVAGILTTVFGLNGLPAQASEVACLWLLHPRLATQERMTGIATAAITDWNNRIKTSYTNDSQSGTARDVSLLIDYLPSFVFPQSEYKITQNLVLGVSLGGHAAWSCILHEPRITAGVIIIGCPDYVNLMADRARLSKLPAWTSSNPPGSQFLGSEAFPVSLLDTVRKYDPASLFLSYMDMKKSVEPLRNCTLPEPTEKEKQALQPLLARCLAGKRILNLSGGIDKLVPYHRGEAFLTWLKQAVSPNGWFSNGAVTLEDVIDESAAHEVTPKMVDEAVRFISDALAANDEDLRKSGFVRESKI
ncbi:unnamed protein product [Aspergillus oryzae var. brunneus]|uniref:Unnamed protein product n=2 Tax=Aspergillus oryzae TaxID=5062 RepID=A0AAN4YNN2_ASPOZ|nr:unnamed protein product [Aspergillus oryzae]GMG31615.1 unnamed protein product [Aspergillus oryzae]GMG41166.1 unnamed protein product [Aspergillus oryzae var. brunneus]